ncbi:hypothetical protein PABG_03661 [Paracoccidioides brasiliensis Pb03]|uniref:Uncharacterized protein n=1 Tax=Paracoccidioides brasiliensis TaxID=121759 RepID=A0A1D2JBY9_PARBR|nr:hypothetical protein PABG_03661 [Paracoccidioides brasiliensis Pb03]ODH25942.1 hypothetical protein ACO22_04943 [Paracoccidioides brasiliensis]
MSSLGVEGYGTVPEELLPIPELTDSLQAEVRKIARVVAAGKSVAGAPGQERDPECLAAKPFTLWEAIGGLQDLAGNEMAEYRALRKTQVIAREVVDIAQSEFERSGRQH